MDSIIKFEDVTFRYDSDDESKPLEPSIKNLSLEIERGSFVAVLGHNGSGKSTLAKLTNAINVPESGRVLVEGLDTADEDNTPKIRTIVGMVFQNPDNQIVATIVEDDVAFGPENLGVEPKEIRKRVDDALKAVNMYDCRESEPHKLSGGQKQRVAIAGVLAMQTKCIVLDEPTAMLDPAGRKDVISTVKRLNKETGITVVLITHYMDEAVQADRVVVMDKGEIYMDGTPAQVFSNPSRLRQTGLDSPQAAVLAEMLRNVGIPMSETVLDADGFVEAFTALMGG